MSEQSYEHHGKVVPLFHRVLIPLNLLVFIGSAVNLYQSLGDHSRLYNASLIMALSVAMILVTIFSRIFPLRAQDRVIRAEENLRHYILTGTLLDPRLTVRQIVGLRFASDGEFLELARKAAEENLSQDAIKRSIKNWRSDDDRV